MRQKPPWEAPRDGISKIEKIAPSRLHFRNTVFFYLCDSGTFPGPRADFRSKNSFPAYWPYTMDRKFAFLDPWGPQNGQKFDLDKNFAFQDHVGSDSGGLPALQRLPRTAHQNSRLDPQNPPTVDPINRYPGLKPRKKYSKHAWRKMFFFSFRSPLCAPGILFLAKSIDK